MIKVKCHTPLDKCRNLEWPTELQVLPRIGENVQALRSEVYLKVFLIVHQQDCVRLELNKESQWLELPR